MKLTAQQRQALLGALLEAFPRRGELERLTLLQLNEMLETIADGRTLTETTLNLITWAESKDRVEELLYGARRENPSNHRLRAVTGQLSLLPAGVTKDRGQLERIVEAANSNLDAIFWLEKLRSVAPAVCRIEISGEAAATGFLVGPDLLLTNYHVLEHVFGGTVSPSSVHFRFDFHRLADGQTFNDGVLCGLAAQNWKVDASPASAIDTVADSPELPSADALDYALVRLSAAIGAMPIGGSGSVADAPPRGYLTIPEDIPQFSPGSAVNILQHPVGAHLKLVLGPTAMLGANTNQTRVRYTTNTEQGSSGAPCFDKNWNLIALHHAGDPSFSAERARYNQGIPISAIRARWARLGIRVPG